MSCELNNFTGRDIEIESLKSLQDLESVDIDHLIQDVISTLKNNKNFSVEITSSDNPDKYEESIQKLIDNVKIILTKQNKLSFKLQKRQLNLLENKLKESLLPRKKTKIELNIEAVIPHVGMLSEDKIESLRFNEILTKIFGNNYIIRTSGEKQFKDKILTLSIIDIDHNIIVYENNMLNERLKRFKSDEYLKLKKFIESINENGKSFDSSLIPNRYYYSDTDVSSQITNAYTIMYNYLNYLSEKDELNDLINIEWNKKRDGEESLFFDALNAYINLQFFDERIKQALGKYIKINKDYDEPITKVNNTYVYKYSFSTGNSNAVKGWETGEYQDAIAQMSGYSQTLIETIPLKSYNNKEKN